MEFFIMQSPNRGNGSPELNATKYVCFKSRSWNKFIWKKLTYDTSEAKSAPRDPSTASFRGWMPECQGLCEPPVAPAPVTSVGAISEDFLLALWLEDANLCFGFSRSRPLEAPMIPNSQQSSTSRYLAVWYSRYLQTHLYFLILNSSPCSSMAESFHALWLGPCLTKAPHRF